MQYLGISNSLISGSSDDDNIKRRRKTKPSSYNVPDYTDIDFARLIEDKTVEQIEDEVRMYIQWLKEHHYARQSITHIVAAICKFFSMNRVRLNKDWLSSFIPRKGNDDNVVVIQTDEDMERQEKGKAYSREQISKLLEFLNTAQSLRTRVMILLMASSGMRLGALPILKYGDLTPVEKHNLYQIRVYSNSRSSIRYTFCTPECREAIDNYLNVRRRHHERITAKSPLFRSEYNTRDEFDSANNVKPISVPTVKRCMSKALYDSGLRTPLAIDTSVSLNNRRAVPMDHGFRKFFFTWCRHAGMEKLDIDWCMGHKLGVDESYFKPDPDSGI
jgi:integrase